MVSFNAAASALVLLASTTLSAADTIRSNRRLSYESIAGYEPMSQVTDHNAIDLDQQAMEQQLALANEDSFAAALKIYSEGAFSKQVAKVTLTAPLAIDVAKGTAFMGINAEGNQIAGKAYADNAAGATSVMIQYKTTDSQADYVGCQVGASTTPVTDGCFVEAGSMTVAGSVEVSYTYNVLSDNIAKRTLQGFSTSAEKKMANCANCPYSMYAKFYDYYGEYDYANQIVLAAFAGEATSLKNFNNDFLPYSFSGREQIIKKGTAYMVAWMYVIREMEDALDDCKEACTIENCNDDPVHAWDEAVAFYTGTLEGTDGSGSGKLAYALADKRCGNFKTCGPEGNSVSGSSQVNTKMFEHFNKGQAMLNDGKCADARKEKDIIENLMLIPLIQGTLRYGWKTENEAYSEKAEAEGTIFALAVTPVLAACDPAAAEVVASNLVAGQAGTADFAAVKAAFEANYECMGVDGAMVGGLYDSATDEYYLGAEPASAGAATSMAIGAAFAAVTSLAMFL